MAVERVREGESAAEVIAAYGFNRTTIYKWLNAALQSGAGHQGAAFDEGDRSAAQPDTDAGSASVSMGQWP